MTMGIKAEEENERPIVIAMKGHPGTGKSTIASVIAKTLRCPLVDKDHFRDCTLPIQETLMLISPTTTIKLLNDLSYDAMWGVIAAQLNLGLDVVVDSPLSCQAHLDRLVKLATSNDARVLVVDCRPGDEKEWRRRLESRGGYGGGHKPATWQDMERLLEGYGGCWDYDVGEVPKLVLDTTSLHLGVGELVNIVLDFMHSCRFS